MKRRYSVGCYCGWRGRRTMHECECYDEWSMSCRCAWGSCPKCNGKVLPTEHIARVMRKNSRVLCTTCVRSQNYRDTHCLERYGSEHCSYMTYDVLTAKDALTEGEKL